MRRSTARRPPPPPAATLSVARARAALALLALTLIVGILARPTGLILVVLVIGLVAIEPKGTLRAIARRARGRDAD